MPAASDPHSPLLLPPSNLLDLDSLLPHIGKRLGGDDHRGDGDDGDEEETKSKSEKYKKNPCIYRGGGAAGGEVILENVTHAILLLKEYYSTSSLIFSQNIPKYLYYKQTSIFSPTSNTDSSISVPPSTPGDFPVPKQQSL